MEGLRGTINECVHDLLRRISEEYLIDINNLIGTNVGTAAAATATGATTGAVTAAARCNHVISGKGKNAGKPCGKLVFDHGYCKAHQGKVPIVLRQLMNQRSELPLQHQIQQQKRQTKQQENIVRLLNTATPKDVTELIPYGTVGAAATAGVSTTGGESSLFAGVAATGTNRYLHDDTQFIFSPYQNTYMVTGKLEKNKKNTRILKIRTEDIDMCERHGWIYTDDVLGDSDDGNDVIEIIN